MIRTVYEKGRVRKTQYVRNDTGTWYCRSTGGKRYSTRWTRVREGWTPDLSEYTTTEVDVILPGGV